VDGAEGSEQEEKAVISRVVGYNSFMATVTVNIDEQLLSRAEELARARHMTVGQMLERLLQVMTQPPLKPEELPPITRSASGLLKAMSDEEVEQAIDEYRTRKYGK
jgi:hypothetical protein